MKLLLVLAVFGCLVVESLCARFHTEHGVTVSAVDEAKARTLVNGIKKANPNTYQQYAVLCLVPVTLQKPTFKELREIGFCTNAAYPSPDRQTHSEDKLLKQVETLKRKYTNNDTYKTTMYDIFLFTYNSPCPRCANTIVAAVKGMASDSLFNGLFISYNQEYDNTLEKTKQIFKAYNEAPSTKKRVTLLPEYHPL